MSISLGNNEIKSIYVGENKVKSIYLGDTNIYKELLPVGGIIFYIDSTSSGATYKFYDANFNEITASVKSSPAWYSKKGTANKDKYYVLSTTTPRNAVFQYSPCTAIGGTESAIGKGRSNTQKIISMIGTGSGTCWAAVKSDNTNKYNGCNDWYIPSINEAEQLFKTNLIINRHIISSTEINSDTYYIYNAYTNYKRKESHAKYAVEHAFTTRSF